MAGSTKKIKAKPAKSSAKPGKKTVAKTASSKPASSKPVASKAAASKLVAGKGVPTKKAPGKKVTSSTESAKAKAPEPQRKIVAPAKPEAVKAVPKKRTPPLTPKELQTITEELDAQRIVLEKELEDLDLGSLNIAQSELSGEVSFDEDYADAGTFTFERERDFSLSNNIKDLIEKVDIAKRRIAEGTYGLCEHCGNPIDKARLKALPYSVLCISCKQREERTR